MPFHVGCRDSLSVVTYESSTTQTYKKIKLIHLKCPYSETAIQQLFTFSAPNHLLNNLRKCEHGTLSRHVNHESLLLICKEVYPKGADRSTEVF